jgi:hypothetical protein
MPPDGRLIAGFAGFAGFAFAAADVLLNEELRVILVKRLIRAFKSDSKDIITTI